MESKGLDEQGFIRREGDLTRVQPEFACIVTEFRNAAGEAFSGRGLDSLYLYGSIPRGTARRGHSDFDAQILLGRDPSEDDRAAVSELETALAAAHREVSAVGILLHSRTQMIDPSRRFDEGFHIRVLCTPLLGPDAGAEVTPHWPDWELARHVQGDWRAAFAQFRTRVQDSDITDEAALCRAVGRRLARVAFTWVMPCWQGWTSNPRQMSQVVSQYEPSWASSMRSAVRLGWEGRADADSARSLLGTFADQLTQRGEAILAGGGQPR